MPRLRYDPQPRRPPSREQAVTVNLRRAPANVRVEPHAHAWAQLAFPVKGAMQVAAAGMSWIVPVFRAVWIPPHIVHEVAMLGEVEMRTLYIHADAAPLPLDACAVVELSPLLRTLIDALGQGGSDRRSQLMMQLILEEIASRRPCRSASPCRATGASRPCATRS